MDTFSAPLGNETMVFGQACDSTLLAAPGPGAQTLDRPFRGVASMPGLSASSPNRFNPTRSLTNLLSVTKKQQILKNVQRAY